MHCTLPTRVQRQGTVARRMCRCGYANLVLQFDSLTVLLVAVLHADVIALCWSAGRLCYMHKSVHLCSQIPEWQHLLTVCTLSKRVLDDDASIVGLVADHVDALKAVATSSGYERAAWARQQLEHVLQRSETPRCAQTRRWCSFGIRAPMCSSSLLALCPQWRELHERCQCAGGPVALITTYGSC